MPDDKDKKGPPDLNLDAQPPPAVPAVTSQGQPQRLAGDTGQDADPTVQTGAGAGNRFLHPPAQAGGQPSAEGLEEMEPVTAEDEPLPRSIVRRDPGVASTPAQATEEAEGEDEEGPPPGRPAAPGGPGASGVGPATGPGTVPTRAAETPPPLKPGERKPELTPKAEPPKGPRR